MQNQLLESQPKSTGWDLLILDNLEESFLQKTAEFLQEFIRKDADPVWTVDYFKWKLGEQNPAGRGFLTCAVSEGRVVGAVSATVKRLWFNQQLVLGAEVGDTYTHPDFVRLRPARGETPDFLKQSIFGRLATETRTRAMSRGIPIVYGTPNANARPGWEKRLGYKSHSSYDNRSFIRPTARGLESRGAVFKLASLPIFAGERTFKVLTHTFCEIQRFARGYKVEQMQESTEELDKLWNRLKGQHLFSLVRDRAYVQYRFFNHPLAKYKLFKISRHRRMEGFLVTRNLITPWGKRYCCLADWWIDESKPFLFPILVSHAIHEQDPTRIDGFYLWCGPYRKLRKSLRQLGFLRGPESPVIFFQNAEGSGILERCRDLDFTLAGSDNI